MPEHRSPSDNVLARLLAEHYQEVEMEAVYRTSLFQATRSVVTSHRKVEVQRRALAWAALAAVVVMAFLWWQGLKPPVPSLPTVSPRTAVSPQAPSPVAKGPEVRVAAGATGGSTAAAAGGGKAAPAPGRQEVAPPVPAPEQPATWAVIAAHGEVAAEDGKALKVGDKLADGSVLRTGPGGLAVLVTRVGSELALNERSEVATALADGGATLRQGEVYCRSRRGELKQLITAAGEIRLLGTVLNAAVQDQDRVAVTVVEGKVKLENRHGVVEVKAGEQALLVAALPPQAGAPVNVTAVTAWYDGRGRLLSDFGDIAYLVSRDWEQSLATEIWVMKSDGSAKHRLKTYLGWAHAPGPWLPGQQSVMLNTGSVLWTHPDFKARRASAGGGHPIIENQGWLVNAATGQDAQFAFPVGYDPLYMDLSPDATKVAFCGSYRPDPKSREGVEGGVWVYDLTTGGIKKALDGWIKTPVNWSPDSRYLSASSGQGYGSSYPLVVVDTQTGKVRELGVQGADAHFSPDGKKLAYPGEFQGTGSWNRGVLASGRIMVFDLTKDQPPVAVSPAGEGALSPTWSPDGTQVAYHLNKDTYTNPDDGQVIPKYELYVAAADGSGSKLAYSAPEGLRAFAWMPNGDGLFVFTDKGVHIIAADGRGQVTDLGGTVDDSVLSTEAKAQTEGALAGLQEAVFQYAVGNIKSFEGRPADSQAAFRTSADLFAGLAWRFPLADLSQEQLLLYADKADTMAAKSAATILADSGKERLNYLQILLLQYLGEKASFPPDLATLEKWSLKAGWGINYLSNRDTNWVRLIFRCPAGGSFAYTPPPVGKDPQVGDVLVACTSHPEERIVWDKEMAQSAERRRQSAANQAVEKDPALKQLRERLGEVQAAAEVGLASWDQVVALAQELMDKQPYYPDCRELLGRIYTRRGQCEKALALLSPTAGGWSELHRAFCYDRLGQREKALAIYKHVAETMQGSTMAIWAERGLQQPSWPQDLAIPTEPGEVRLEPTAEWKAIAPESGQGSKPEFALDRKPNTRWLYPGKENGQVPGEWFQLDFGSPLSVTRVALDHNGAETIYTNDWPRGIKASATADGQSWFPVNVEQAGLLTPAVTTLDSTRPIRAIRFETTTTHSPEWWSIAEIYVFGPAS